MKKTISILVLTSAHSFGATVWSPALNSQASAAWDTFAFASATAGDSGSQGAAQTISGALISGSELATEITQSYDSPPGGFLGNPDTYYLHNGAANWTASLSLLSPVTHVRVSYSLLGFGGGAPDAYGQTPVIDDAVLINSGRYDTATNTVYFYDLALDIPSSAFATNFGDTLFPGFPGSFRSIDGVQLEVFDSVPIPEPSSMLFTSLALIPLLRRQRRHSK